MIIRNNQLNSNELNAVDNLVALCSSVEKGNAPLIYRHLLIEDRHNNNNILYYQSERLIGFLSVYFFYEDACEASLLVDPLYRRQGIARQMLQQILPLLLITKIQRIIFSTAPNQSYDWLTSLGFEYYNSEYHMQRNHQNPLFIAEPKLTIQPATQASISDLLTIDAACFPFNQSAEMPQRFQNLLNDRQYSLFLAFYQDIAIGKVHLRWLQNNTILSDLAILPRYQNQGFGSELIAWCINHVLGIAKEKPLELDVETTNQNALQLYAKYDFEVNTANDFWVTTTDNLIKFL